MSEEEKKAIEFLKTFIKTEIDYYKLEKNDATDILNLIEKQDNKIKFFIENEIALKEMNRNQMKIIEKQQKEIEEKATILLAGAEKVKQLEKEIQRLEKDNDTLSELVIVNEDKVIKELDLISKDKIRELLKSKDIELTGVISYRELEELLEEN